MRRQVVRVNPDWLLIGVCATMLAILAGAGWLVWLFESLP